VTVGAKAFPGGFYARYSSVPAVRSTTAIRRGCAKAQREILYGRAEREFSLFFSLGKAIGLEIWRWPRPPQSFRTASARRRSSPLIERSVAEVHERAFSDAKSSGSIRLEVMIAKRPGREARPRLQERENGVEHPTVKIQLMSTETTSFRGVVWGSSIGQSEKSLQAPGSDSRAFSGEPLWRTPSRSF
jgi:hypothetical protein